MSEVYVAAGMCGENVRYEIVENGKTVLLQGECGEVNEVAGLTLIISGSGLMTDYEKKSEVPYAEYKNRITDAEVCSGVGNVGDCAFADCALLSSVKMARSVKYIGVYGFKGCAALAEVKFPEGLRYIGPKSFEKCDGLKKLVLPSSLRSIDFKAFNGLTSIEKIKYNGSEEEWERCVRVSESARGNANIFSAGFRFRKESSSFYKMCASAGRIARQGGDGRVHVIAPNLRVAGAKGKSGDCTLIVFPDGKTMLIDTGAPFTSERMLEFVKALGLAHYDYLVISHPHGDHIGNAKKIAEYLFEECGGGIGNYWYSGYESRKPDERELAEYLEAHGTKMNRCVREGQIFDIGGVHIETFNPTEDTFAVEGSSDDIVNNTSIAFKLTYGKSSYLTCGDLYRNREKILAEKFGDRLQADVFKTDHHCAFTSNCAEIFDAIKPKYLISCEDGGYWSLFDERIKKQKIKNYSVSECGMVELTFDQNKKYKFKTEF